MAHFFASCTLFHLSLTFFDRRFPLNIIVLKSWIIITLEKEMDKSFMIIQK